MELQRNRTNGSAVTKRHRFVPNWYLLTLAIAVIVALVITVCLLLAVKGKEKLYSVADDVIECPGLSDADCSEKGCTYVAADVGPSCFMNKNDFGYTVEDVVQESDGPRIRLKSRVSQTPYGPSLKNVTFKITYLSENILRFQFKDTDAERYEVPVQKEFPLLQKESSEETKGNLTYKVNHTSKDEVFQFTVKRADGADLWDTSIGALLLSDKYLQIGSYLPSKNVYGIGEHVHETLRHSMEFKSWPLFAGDNPPVVPTNGKNLYGVHPFYTCLEKPGKSHGVFFLNSNAMEVTFLPAPAVTFRTIGGILDFFIFVGDNPEHVVQLYTSLIGRPMIPPYWGLGFQLSKYGYNETDEVKRVLDRNRKAKIPQAVQYLDIDHMSDAMDFTYDDLSFSGLPELINTTKSDQSLKWVIILEPYIAAVMSSQHYTSGMNQSIFVKRSPDWNPNIFPEDDHIQKENVTFGKVWPKNVVAFLDFFRSETRNWWKEQLVKHRQTINFDGLWIDMNEPANFGTNEDYPFYCQIDNIDRRFCWSLKCPDGPYEAPPYNPLKATNSEMLSHKTICMNSVQGNNDTEYLHYDVHSLFGWSQTGPTLEAAQEATGTRSLVISRSTYPSSGRYAGHWLGDNRSSFLDMQRSIIGMLEFNLFGIPYVGADVCGFFGEASPELCKKWMQLGAFYPYYRNHNAKESPPQDPAVYGVSDDKLGVVALSRKAIERRLCLNPYLYTLFYKAYVNGSTVVRPVFHEFPTDEMTLDMATQFMWGSSLMIVPILGENQTTVPVYFPKDEWWIFKEEMSKQRVFSGRYVIEVEAKEYVPVYVRGGTILPYGNYDWENYPEKSDTRNITLYVFPKDGQASGDLFMDDGISIDTVENKAYGFYKFEYNSCSVKVTTNEYEKFNGTYPFLERVVIFNVVGFSNISADYGTQFNQTCQCAIVNVGQQMKEVKEFSWQDLEGHCPHSK